MKATENKQFLCPESKLGKVLLSVQENFLFTHTKP